MCVGCSWLGLALSLAFLLCFVLADFLLLLFRALLATLLAPLADRWPPNTNGTPIAQQLPVSGLQNRRCALSLQKDKYVQAQKSENKRLLCMSKIYGVLSVARQKHNLHKSHELAKGLRNCTTRGCCSTKGLRNSDSFIHLRLTPIAPKQVIVIQSATPLEQQRKLLVLRKDYAKSSLGHTRFEEVV